MSRVQVCDPKFEMRSSGSAPNVQESTSPELEPIHFTRSAKQLKRPGQARSDGLAEMRFDSLAEFGEGFCVPPRFSGISRFESCR